MQCSLYLKQLQTGVNWKINGAIVHEISLIDANMVLDDNLCTYKLFTSNFYICLLNV
jgi:hypothetical protein